jgi:hypothetical protein
VSIAGTPARADMNTAPGVLDAWAATTTYIKAALHEVATALAAMTGQPHPSPTHDSARPAHRAPWPPHAFERTTSRGPPPRVKLDPSGPAAASLRDMVNLPYYGRLTGFSWSSPPSDTPWWHICHI